MSGPHPHELIPHLGQFAVTFMAIRAESVDQVGSGQIVNHLFGQLIEVGLGDPHAPFSASHIQGAIVAVGHVEGSKTDPAPPDQGEQVFGPAGTSGPKLRGTQQALHANQSVRPDQRQPLPLIQRVQINREMSTTPPGSVRPQRCIDRRQGQRAQGLSGPDPIATGSGYRVCRSRAMARRL